MKNFGLSFSAALILLLFPLLPVRANIFEAPEDQIYLESLNNLERLRLSTFGGIHGGNRVPADDLKFLEMTMRELQKKHRGDKELLTRLNNVKKTMQQTIKVYSKKKDLVIIHGPCEKNTCVFLNIAMQNNCNIYSDENYPVKEIIGRLEPKIQKVEYRRRGKLETEGLERLQNYAEKLSAFDKSCKELSNYIRQLMPK